MKDWNVVVSVFQDGYSRALRALQKLGVAERSPYHNVLVMKVNDPAILLEAIEKRTEESPALYDAISRVAPAMRNFDFLSEEEFIEKAKVYFSRMAAATWLGGHFTCDCAGAAQNTICKHRRPSGCSIMPLSTRRRAQGCQARYRSRIRTW